MLPPHYAHDLLKQREVRTRILKSCLRLDTGLNAFRKLPKLGLKRIVEIGAIAGSFGIAASRFRHMHRSGLIAQIRRLIFNMYLPGLLENLNRSVKLHDILIVDQFIGAKKTALKLHNHDNLLTAACS